MATVDRTCEECGASFTAKPSEVRNGYAKFCSRPCSHASLRARSEQARAPLTAARLQEMLRYEPTTGVLTWIRPLNSRVAKPGDVAGTVLKTGYVYVGVHGRKYMAHRLACLWMTGEWPTAEIDHVNGEKADNRWSNLRDVTRTVNNQNILRAKGQSASGLLGVKKHGTRWQASICANGVETILGSFATKEAGHAAYLKAKSMLHPECGLFAPPAVRHVLLEH